MSIRAFIAYINELAAAKNASLLKELRKKHGPWLQQNTKAWGAMGYALASCKLNKPVVDWMQDWRGKKDAGQWMLFNYMSSLRYFERYDEACEVSRYALELKRDNTAPQHLLWLAFETAVAGNTAEAERFLAGMGESKLTDYFQAVHEITKAVLKIQNMPAGERGKISARFANSSPGPSTSKSGSAGIKTSNAPMAAQ